MRIFPPAPEQIIAHMWSNGVQGSAVTKCLLYRVVFQQYYRLFSIHDNIILWTVLTRHSVNGFQMTQWQLKWQNRSNVTFSLSANLNPNIKRSLTGQTFPGCHPMVRLSFAEVPAGYLLWYRCTAELHVLNDEYTRQWHLPMQVNWWDNSSAAANVLNILTCLRY